MTRIFDNIHADLGPHLVATFEASDRMDTAVGYFNLRGWSLFAPTVEARQESNGEPLVRVLIGMTSADPDKEVHRRLERTLEGHDEEEDEIDREVARTRRQQALLTFRTQLMRGVPNAEDLQTLQALKRQISDGRVQAKLFTRRPLHGKAYLCHRQDLNSPIVGFVGSSNLTLSGMRNNYELNVDVLDYNAADALSSWFNDRWEDVFTLDITDDLVELIEESWAGEARRHPYEVYLKVCYHLSRDVREGLVEYSVPLRMREQLLDYQIGAVQTLARRVVTRGGTMLGDVVGLGKTITAVATALMLREEHGYSTLVVCPKNLVKMWQGYLDAYDVPGRVIPYSMAAKELPSLRRYQFVVVDESHTLRNETRQDYKALAEYINENGSRVLLLTATPYNMRFRDVANQLALYVGDDDDLGLQPIAAMRKNPQLIDRVDGKTTTLLAFRLSEEPDDWKRLMSDHLVRRTRSFIKSNYANVGEDGREYLVFASGERFYFPDRVARPVEHSFGAADPAALMASEDTLDAIDALKLPRYNLASYLRSDVARDASEQSLVDRLERAHGHLIGFVRTGLYKRLSSAGSSFILSLQRHLARNELWIYALEKSLQVPVGSILDPMLASAETDEDVETIEGAPDDSTDYAALVARNPRNVTWIRSELFSGPLLEDLRRDSDAIRELLVTFGDWTYERDSKLSRLIELLRVDHADEKVVVFTEYKDTADYVTTALKANGIDHVAGATGSTSDPTAVARRFAPRSNALPGQTEVLPTGDEFRVLVATDVLSEGQNLQDAHIVVNYDLPWSIIRLIQRAGRVDRVGQQSEIVYVYSFFHEDVENVLRLRARIRQRLERNAEVFGSDERFFGTDEETKTIEDLYHGQAEGDETDAEVDASSLAYEVWSKAERDDPELARRVMTMPDLVDATRPAKDGEGGGVACYVRTEGGVDGFGFGDGRGALTLITGHEALRVFSCSRETPALPRASNHFAITAELARGPLSRPDQVEGRLRGVRKRVWNRLNGALVTANSDVAEALDALFRRPLTRDAEQRLRIALSTRSDDDDLGDLVALLYRDDRLVVADIGAADPIRIVCTMGIAE
jgi:superfamily II DNA or RNA helicase